MKIAQVDVISYCILKSIDQSLAERFGLVKSAITASTFFRLLNALAVDHLNCNRVYILSFLKTSFLSGMMGPIGSLSEIQGDSRVEKTGAGRGHYEARRGEHFGERESGMAEDKGRHRLVFIKVLFQN